MMSAERMGGMQGWTADWMNTVGRCYQRLRPCDLGASWDLSPALIGRGHVGCTLGSR